MKGSRWLVVPEPSRGDAARPVAIESDKTPADIGVHVIRFVPFLGTSDLVDVVA